MDEKDAIFLKTLLPKIKCPKTCLDTVKYPITIFNILKELIKDNDNDNIYQIFQNITETLIHDKKVNYDTLIKTIEKYTSKLSDIQQKKIIKSKTTLQYIESIKNTIEKIPDNHVDIFEIKIVKKIKEIWNDYLLEIFSRASLNSNINQICILFPLQEEVWNYDISKWENREKYRKYLNKISDDIPIIDNVIDNEEEDSITFAKNLMQKYNIGWHTKKDKLLYRSFEDLPDYTRHYQLFLGSNISFRLSISDEELSKTLKAVNSLGVKMFVHSQYIINLCNENSSDLLIRNLRYANSSGFKGVVVHVGKYTKRDQQKAINTMRENIETALLYATEECPILLETPAGQGTETLTECKEFVDFVKSFNSKLIRICVDTCHVFVCGSDPLDYIKNIDKDLIKLIHFNDSKTVCGSCVDRHEMIGSGFIGKDKMQLIGKYCFDAGFPMLYEG